MEIRRLRQRAGWSLAELASRVGVTIPSLQAWEVGRRSVPVGRLILLEGALAEAQAEGSADSRRLVELEQRIGSHGPEGVSESELRHSLRRRNGDGKHAPSATLDRDLAQLARKGSIVRSRVALSDRLGRPKERDVLVHAKWSPRRDSSQRMTGDALADARHRLGVTQQELALVVGTHQSEINRLEHQHDRRTTGALDRAPSQGSRRACWPRFPRRRPPLRAHGGATKPARNTEMALARARRSRQGRRASASPADRLRRGAARRVMGRPRATVPWVVPSWESTHSVEPQAASTSDHARTGWLEPFPARISARGRTQHRDPMGIRCAHVSAHPWSRGSRSS